MDMQNYMQDWLKNNNVWWHGSEFRKLEPAGNGILQTDPSTGITHVHQPIYWSTAPDGSVITHYPVESLWNGFFQLNCCPFASVNPFYDILWTALWVILPLFVIFCLLPYLYDNSRKKNLLEELFLMFFFLWYAIFLYANQWIVFAILLALATGGPGTMLALEGGADIIRGLTGAKK